MSETNERVPAHEDTLWELNEYMKALVDYAERRRQRSQILPAYPETFYSGRVKDVVSRFHRVIIPVEAIPEIIGRLEAYMGQVEDIDTVRSALHGAIVNLGSYQADLENKENNDS